MANNVYFYYGNDEYLVDSHARETVERLVPKEEQALALEIIDGDAAKIDAATAVIDQCIAGFRTVGLFGGKKVVWFRNVSFFKSSVIMKNAQIKLLLGHLASDLKAGLADDQFLVVSASGVDKRSAFFKALKAAGETAEFTISERDYEARPAALKRARTLFSEAGFTINPDAADLFIDKTGYETRQIMSEVEKMTLYKGDDKTITHTDVQIITSASSEAISWDFTDAIAERKLGEAIRLFRQLLFQKQTAVGLIIQIETQFHNLLRFREYMDAGWLRMNGTRIQWSSDPELDAYFEGMADDPRKMHWFRASKFASQAMPYSANGLAARRQLVLDTHERMISEGTIPHELLLETLLAKLCAPRPRRK